MSVGAALDPDALDLATLHRQYAGHPASIRALWSQEYVDTEIDLRRFRADSAYLWQRNHDADSYRVSHDWLAVSEPRILAACSEDGAFGAKTINVSGKLVSRDLLDSVAELGFLVSELGPLEGLSVLDIGAGYGRLAHRAHEAMPWLSWACTDAIPESTLLCRRYLKFRNVPAEVVPLHKASAYMELSSINLAISVHNFPELPASVIEWWLCLLATHEVQFLFIVPNTLNELITFEPSGSREDFAPLLRRYGYQREAARMKYRGRNRRADWLFQDAHLLYVLR